jgi:thiosulfate/3-mercaptopyruvate sulfurtransferase
VIKHFSQLSAAVIAAFGLSVAHAGVLPGPVIDTQWLASNLDKVQVIEVRGDVKSFITAPEFDTDAKTGKKVLTDVGGHIPGSKLIDMKTMRVDRMVGDQKVKYMIPEQADFQKRVQAEGVEAGKPIVLVPVGVDGTDMDDALRVYWQFKVYGEDNIAVLDGGMATWLAEGRAFSQAPADTAGGTWVAKADRSQEYGATSDDVVKAMANKSATLVDTRDVASYQGLTKRDYVFGYGHLDGAKLYSIDLMFKKNGAGVKMLSPNTYRALLTAQGVDPSAALISYCNSGHLSSGPWFVASEILGNKNAKLYDGSLHEWTLEKRQLVGAVPLQ